MACLLQQLALCQNSLFQLSPVFCSAKSILQAWVFGVFWFFVLFFFSPKSYLVWSVRHNSAALPFHRLPSVLISGAIWRCRALFVRKNRLGSTETLQQVQLTLQSLFKNYILVSNQLKLWYSRSRQCPSVRVTMKRLSYGEKWQVTERFWNDLWLTLTWEDHTSSRTALWPHFICGPLCTWPVLPWSSSIPSCVPVFRKDCGSRVLCQLWQLSVAHQNRHYW